MSRYVLGISAHYHDAAAALFRDGELVAAANEERFSRVKHDASLPLRAVKFCLERAGISAGDLEAAVYYEKPLRKFERILVTQLAAFPKSRPAFQGAMLHWLSERLWLPATMPKDLGVPPNKMLWCDHHLSHAASAFYTSPFDEAAILVADGVGEWASTTLYKGGASGIERLAEIRFPHSIGLVYSAFTAWLGFQVNDGEYKVMGMAPFGEPRYVDEVRKVLKSTGDGGFEVDTKYVAYHWSASDSTTAAFDALFGTPRFPGAPFDPRTPEGKKYADVAASIQKVTEDALVELAAALHEKTGSTNLCMAGGVALNSVANRYLLTRTPFQRLWVHPASGDAGGAVGAAAWAWVEALGGARPAPMTRPDLGWESTEGETRKLLDDLAAVYEELVPEQVAIRAAEDIAAGKVIGWSQGRFEWGPRALGHRSILADPSRREMLDVVNTRIKFREPFRPFAPSVRAGDEGRYFDVPSGAEQPVDWMLCVCPTREAARDFATTHVDGSARCHTVREAANPLYHRLLCEVGERTGHPMVLNTSFNLKGEPIVSTPLDALATFRRCALDTLYVGNFRVTRGDREPPAE